MGITVKRLDGLSDHPGDMGCCGQSRERLGGLGDPIMMLEGLGDLAITSDEMYAMMEPKTSPFKPILMTQFVPLAPAPFEPIVMTQFVPRTSSTPTVPTGAQSDPFDPVAAPADGPLPAPPPPSQAPAADPSPLEVEQQNAAAAADSKSIKIAIGVGGALVAAALLMKGR